MTAPAETPASQDPTALVQAVKARAVELGISWQLLTGRMATTTTVVVDGDTVAVPCINVSGAHPEGTPVAMMRVPPSGLYVLGATTGSEAAQVVARGEATCTALAALTTTPTLMTGASVTVTAPSTVYYEVTGFYDLESTVAGASVGQGFLYVDAVQQTRQALQSLASVGRGTVGQQWSGTLAAGNHTFEMYAGKSAAAATGRINATHSNIKVTFYA